MKSAMKITKETDKVSRLDYLSEVHKFLYTVVKQDLDAVRLNIVVNHPEVYKWVHGNFSGPLDLTPIVNDPRHVLIMGEYGGILFVQHQPGLYEGHTQVLPEGRGEWALNMVRAAGHWLYTKTDAMEIIMKAPKGNVAIKSLIRAVRGTYQLTKEGGWVIDNQSVPVDVYSLTAQDWIKTAKGLTERGEWFQNKLEQDTGRKYPFDRDSLRYIGGAVEMILAGQPYKGVILYNRWAAMSGYSPIKIVTESPLVIDIGGVLLMVRNNDFWVMTCQ